MLTSISGMNFVDWMLYHLMNPASWTKKGTSQLTEFSSKAVLE